jgi:hypothetical protein
MQVLYSDSTRYGGGIRALFGVDGSIFEAETGAGISANICRRETCETSQVNVPHL